MDPFIAGGLISGLGSLGASVIGATTGVSQSKELMDYQYRLQQQAIDKANRYNSPAEQMKRLALAHLNPNLVYGSGVDGNQSQPASPSMANRNVNFANPLQDMAQNITARKQYELDQIRVRNEAFESRERQLKLRAETLGQMLENTYNDKTMETRIKSLSQKLANDVASEALTWSRTRNEDNRLEEILANTELLKERKNLTNQQALTEEVKRQVMDKQMQVSEQQIKQMAQYIQFLAAGTKLREQAYDIQDLQILAVKAYKEFRAAHPNISLTLDMVKEILGIANQAKNIVVP